MKIGAFSKSLLLLVGITFLGALLRIPFLDVYPPALYSDEVSQGYNAYSILKTGQDEYGTFMPISFRSFGDWKPPLPTYAMVPTVLLFGLDAYGVRLPSAILGVLTIPFTYLIVVELGRFTKVIPPKKIKLIGIIAAFLVSISPWHIMQSRMAMLVMVELFVLMVALYSFLKGLENINWWYVSGIAWILGIYSYYGMRVIVPMFLLYLLVRNVGHLKKNVKVVITTVSLSFILMIPLIVSFINEPNVLLGRAKTVSIFYDKRISLRVWELITQDGAEINSKLVQFLHNKPYFYVVDILRRFFHHFDGDFLFLTGDTHLPFQIPNMGILYIISGTFLILGIYKLITLKEYQLLEFLIAWIVISVVPASLTFVTPSANRTFTMVIPLLILTAVGIVFVIQLLQKFKFIPHVLIFSMYALSFFYFSHNYIMVIPQKHANWWHFGYSELYVYLENEQGNRDTIAISAKASMPYIFLLFNKKIDPKLISKNINRNYKSDEFGFEHTSAYARYRFPKNYTWEKDGLKLRPSTLLVLTSEETAGDGAQKIKTIPYPNGKPAFEIYEIQETQ